MTDQQDDPLALMVELRKESFKSAGLDWTVELFPQQWSRLRAAIEAQQSREREQAAEIERLRKWNRQMVEKAASGGTLDAYREMGTKLCAKDEGIEMLRARVARLRHFLSEAHVTLGDFEPDDDLSALMFEIKEALNESPRQSVAEIKHEGWCDGWNEGYAARDNEGFEAQCEIEARALERAVDELGFREYIADHGARKDLVNRESGGWNQAMHAVLQEAHRIRKEAKE